MRVLEGAQAMHAMILIFLFAAIVPQAMAGVSRRFASSSRDFSAECRNGRLSENSTLAKGMKAGNFILHRSATNMNACVKLCCSRHSCEVVLFVKERCYEVECVDPEACKPVEVQSTKYRPIIFTKNPEILHPKAEPGSQMISDPNKALIREKRHESCHHYHGSVCSEHLDKNNLLYFSDIPRTIEEKLKSPFSLLKPRLSENCKSHALKAICHQSFPRCKNRLRPSPTMICRKDCKTLEDSVCYTEFKVAKNFEFLARILPNCTALPMDGSPEAEGCISLNLPAISSAFAGRAQDPQILQESGESSASHESSSRGLEEREPLASQKREEAFSTENEDRNEKENENENEKEKDFSSVVKVGPQIAPDESLEQTKDTSTERSILPESESGRNSSAVDSQSRFGSESGGSLKEELQEPENEEGNKGSEQGMPVKSAPQEPAEKVPGDQRMPTDSREPGSENSETDQESEGWRGKPATPNSSPTDELRTLNPTGHSTDGKNKTKDGLQASLGLLEPAVESNHSQSRDRTHAQSPVTDQVQATPTSTVLLATPTKSAPSAPTTPTPNKMVVVNSTNKDEVNLASQPSGPNPPRPTAGEVEGMSKNDSGNHAQIPTKKITNTAEPSGNQTVHTPAEPREQTTEQAVTTKPTPKKPQASLKVSAGDNSQLILPADTISLYASAWPKETLDNPYSYHWQQISAPGGSHGYMAGQDTQRVTLSQLDEPGVYQFKVKVSSADGAYGYAYVNVTVKPAPRVNKPPRADISPKEQTITLPTNEVVLDGSQSSDDDKIAHYKWEEVKGPLNDEHKVISSGADSPVLQLKSLVPGIYTFKLTVTDSDGDSDSTQATVTVNNEKDYPPVARAGNDVVITLPVNHVTLYGNGSTDDKGIVSYEWSKAPSSPAVGDMQGTSSPILKVSNMVVGDYTFMLKVTDRGGQTAVSKVTVVVQPEKNTPPVAKAGSDKDLVYPDDTTTLDGKDSRDDQQIVKYHWQQVSGPDTSDMSGADERVVTVHGLKEGRYVFQLTVTDDKGLTDSDRVAVNVKKDVNKPPQANAGADVVVYLPNRAAELDGSKSTDDHGITEYEWVRDPKSPAAGDVINHSDHQAVLRLSNVVEGMYKFKLTVVDAKGLKSSDEAILTVKEDENSAHLVELYLDVDITKFTQDNKEQLIRKLAVILNVQDEDITVEHLKETGSGHSLMVIFYVKGKLDGHARDGQDVADLLKEKIENEEGFFEFRMLKVEPYICRNNCSGHGYCDKVTKLCVCESFWMQDFFKTNFGVKETNCDWSILYVTVILFGIIMGIVGIIWGLCYCMGRKRLRGRKRHRYAILDDDDDDKDEGMEMLPKGKYMDFSDTEEDSDEETTVFEAKKRIMNGTMNGHLRRDT